MKIIELFESPIGNLEVHNMDVPGTFPDIDRQLLKSPEHIKNIRYRFKNIPYLFHLYFVNRTDVKYTHSYNIYDRTAVEFSDDFLIDLEELAGITNPENIKKLFNIDVKPDSNGITVFYCSNANIQNSISMTPWIIAHRFAHAIMDEDRIFLDEISKLRNIINRLGRPMINGDFLDNKYFFTFRSAINGTLLSEERLVELITQFIMTGRNRLEINPKKIDQFSPEAISAIQSSLDTLETEMAKCIDSMLDKCIGKIFITV